MFFRSFEVFWVTFQEAVCCLEEFTFAICVQVISWIATTFLSVHQVDIDDVEEEETCRGRDQRSKRGDKIPKAV